MTPRLHPGHVPRACVMWGLSQDCTGHSQLSGRVSQLVTGGEAATTPAQTGTQGSAASPSQRRSRPCPRASGEAWPATRGQAGLRHRNSRVKNGAVGVESSGCVWSSSWWCARHTGKPPSRKRSFSRVGKVSSTAWRPLPHLPQTPGVPVRHQGCLHMVREPGSLFPESPGCSGLRGGPSLAQGHPAKSERPEQPSRFIVTAARFQSPQGPGGPAGLQARRPNRPLSRTRWLAPRGPAGGAGALRPPRIARPAPWPCRRAGTPSEMSSGSLPLQGDVGRALPSPRDRAGLRGVLAGDV